jgi:ABC-type transport system involved in multi-copper enzyme maturation permease subunit
MKHPLLWREWKGMGTAVSWSAALVTFLAVVMRIVDDVRGVAVMGAFLAILFGNSATFGDRTSRIREFLLTRPVSRTRILGAKLFAMIGILNLFLVALAASALLDLPGRFYGLFADTGIGERIVVYDFPAWYPAAILFANLLLLLVAAFRLLARPPLTGGVVAVVLCVLTWAALAKALQLWPDAGAELATAFAGAFAGVAVLILLFLVRGFRRIEVTGVSMP